MAKKKGNKIGLFDLIMILAALVGVVLAVVGICVPFFQQVTKTGIGDPEPINMGLFDDYAGVEFLMDGGLTIGVIMAFAIISLVLTILAAAIVLLGKFGIIRFKGLAKLILAIIVIVFAALVIVFSASYAGQSPLNVDGGSVVSTAFLPAIGAYFVMAGGVVTGVTLLLSRLK